MRVNLNAMMMCDFARLRTRGVGLTRIKTKKECTWNRKGGCDKQQAIPKSQILMPPTLSSMFLAMP